MNTGIAGSVAIRRVATALFLVIAGLWAGPALAACSPPQGQAVIGEAVQTMSYKGQLARPERVPVIIALNEQTGAWSYTACEAWGAEVSHSGTGWMSTNAPSNNFLPLLPPHQPAVPFDPGYCRTETMRNQMSNRTVCGAAVALDANLGERMGMILVARGFALEWKDQQSGGQPQAAYFHLYVATNGKWALVRQYPERGDIAVVWAEGEKMKLQAAVRFPPARVAAGDGTGPYSLVDRLSLIDMNWAQAVRRGDCSASGIAGSPVAEGSIRRFNARVSEEPVPMQIYGAPGQSWDMVLTGTGGCRVLALRGPDLDVRDYSGSALAVGTIEMPTTGQWNPTCEDANNNLVVSSSLSGTPSDQTYWCKPYYEVVRTFESQGYSAALGGAADDIQTGRRSHVIIHVNGRSGSFRIVQAEPNGAAIVLAEGSGFRVAPEVIDPLRQRTQLAEQEAERRRIEAEQAQIAKQRADEQARIAEAAAREERRKAELARLIRLDSQGTSAVTIGNVTINVSNAADASVYFGQWAKGFGLSTVGRNLAGLSGGGSNSKSTSQDGKFTRDCWQMFSSSACLYLLGGKAVGMSFSYSGDNCIDCNGGIVGIRNPAIEQGLQQTASSTDRDITTTVYKRGSLCMVHTHYRSSYSEQERDMFNRETGRWVTKYRQSERIVIVAGSALPYLDERECGA